MPGATAKTRYRYEPIGWHHYIVAFAAINVIIPKSTADDVISTQSEKDVVEVGRTETDAFAVKMIIGPAACNLKAFDGEVINHHIDIERRIGRAKRNRFITGSGICTHRDPFEVRLGQSGKIHAENVHAAAAVHIVVNSHTGRVRRGGDGIVLPARGAPCGEGENDSQRAGRAAGLRGVSACAVRADADRPFLIP